ncbi:lasso RiPP family leader peptide-containing protein [Nonomuraea sp. NPDC049714]
MATYTTPSLTRVGGFRALTKSLGGSPYNDIFGYPALFVIWP